MSTPSKSYSITAPHCAPRRITVYGGDGIDLDAEAEHVAEAIAALEDAKFHFDRIKGATNRVLVSMSLPRIEAAMDRERKELARITHNAHLRAERYKAEAIGFACKDALGIRGARVHAQAMTVLEAQERAEQDEAARKAQREREAAFFRDVTLQTEQRPQRQYVKKVSDASLIAEVRTKRHRSISDLARAVGLSIPNCSVRLNALTKAGKLGANEVPRGTGGRPTGACVQAGAK